MGRGLIPRLLLMDVDRYLGCLVGLAVGDALGTTVEFCARGSFEPVKDMRGGGPFNLNPGEWTDDTSMALCLAHSLLCRKGFDAADQMNRYCNWADWGYMSSTGECFDIGGTVLRALQRYEQSREPFAGSTDPSSAGNGAIMRLAPVPMYFANSWERTVHFSGESARTTHGALEAVEATRLFGAQLRLALLGGSKQQILLEHGYVPAAESIAEIAAGAYARKNDTAIKGSGYVVRSLEAALWCFSKGQTYAEAVLMAVNLGDDADTTAAICGQIAGAYYGHSAIPSTWRDRIAMGKEIEAIAIDLHTARES